MKLILFEDAEAHSKQQIYATFVWRAVVVGSGGELACTAVWAVKVSRCPSSPSAGCNFCSREMQKTVKINQSILTPDSNWTLFSHYYLLSCVF